jgi:hypothetical protein
MVETESLNNGLKTGVLKKKKDDDVFLGRMDSAGAGTAVIAARLA